MEKPWYPEIMHAWASLMASVPAAGSVSAASLTSSGAAGHPRIEDWHCGPVLVDLERQIPGGVFIKSSSLAPFQSRSLYISEPG
eukprot:6934183-Pyramimonas_sp.AAC.1